MDILSRVKSDQLFDLELLDPVDESKLGIVVQLRSVQSDEVKAVARKHADANMLRNQKGKALKSTVLEDQAEERVAVMIADWEWSPNHKLGASDNPECNKKNRAILVKNDNFFDQINEAASNVANFTMKSEEPSAKPPK